MAYGFHHHFNIVCTSVIANGYVAPISDAKNVNKRRKEAGFDLTVEENAKRLGTTYKEYTYEDIEWITRQKK